MEIRRDTTSDSNVRDATAWQRESESANLSTARTAPMWQKNNSNDASSAPTLNRAAEFVRMSTEHQQYSTENQADKIREYARQRGIQIVRTYADEGKSGLSIDGRQALQQLIRDVESGHADFEMILVYDVSRWGRFQDADESAYYEYICRRAGIQVTDCAELCMRFPSGPR
jgi:predicted site-specific integrase-resolvase